jgi:hypothetical protein
MGSIGQHGSLPLHSVGCALSCQAAAAWQPLEHSWPGDLPARLVYPSPRVTGDILAPDRYFYRQNIYN